MEVRIITILVSLIIFVSIGLNIYQYQIVNEFKSLPIEEVEEIEVFISDDNDIVSESDALIRNVCFGGLTAELGQQLKIVWDGSNIDKVNIVLLDHRAGDNYHVIATDVSFSEGYFYWYIPLKFIYPGEKSFALWIGEYKPPAQKGDWEPLREEAESMIYYQQERISIMGDYVQLNRPSPRDVWSLGQSEYLTWMTSRVEKINIILLDERDNSYRVIATDISQTNQPYSWNVSSDLSPGNSFRVYMGTYRPLAQKGDWSEVESIACSFPHVYDLSDRFTIE